MIYQSLLCLSLLLPSVPTIDTAQDNANKIIKYRVEHKRSIEQMENDRSELLYDRKITKALHLERLRQIEIYRRYGPHWHTHRHSYSSYGYH